MKFKKLILLGLASFSLFSCGEVESSSSNNTCIMINRFILTKELEGEIHKIPGEGDYFKFDGAYFKILLNKGETFTIPQTLIYRNGELLDHKSIDENTFKEGAICLGKICYANGSDESCAWQDKSFVAPYLAELRLN